MSAFLPVRNIALVLVFATLPVVVHANIGEDLVHLRARYGSVTYVGPQLLFEVRLNQGQIQPAAGNPEEHLTVTVYLDNDRSVMEVFTRNSSDPAKSEISPSDIDTILAAASDGQKWSSVEVSNGKQTWVREDKKILGRLSPNSTGDPNGASVFIVMLNSK